MKTNEINAFAGGDWLQFQKYSIHRAVASIVMLAHLNHVTAISDTNNSKFIRQSKATTLFS
jgi:hypothetical protein